MRYVIANGYKKIPLQSVPVAAAVLVLSMAASPVFGQVTQQQLEEMINNSSTTTAPTIELNPLSTFTPAMCSQLWSNYEACVAGPQVSPQCSTQYTQYQADPSSPSVMLALQSCTNSYPFQGCAVPTCPRS